MDLQKTFNFGKVDYYGRGRRVNKVGVTVRLYDKGDGRVVFSACGDIWNGRGTDIVCGGQCLDEIAKLVKDPTFKKIYGWWKKYHNNDMHAGTPEQEKYLKEHKTWRGDYDRDCELLKNAGLYEVRLGGKHYRYGEKWLYEPIPEKDLAEMKAFLSE
jgi:hypothetical protein